MKYSIVTSSGEVLASALTQTLVVIEFARLKRRGATGLKIIEEIDYTGKDDESDG